MRTLRALALPGVLLLTLCLVAAPGLRADAPTLDGVYAVEGDGVLGRYKGEIKFSPGSGGTEVSGAVKFENGEVSRVAARGTIEEGVLKVDWGQPEGGALERLETAGNGSAAGRARSAAAAGRIVVYYTVEKDGAKATGRRLAELGNGAPGIELATEKLTRKDLKDLKGTLLRIAKRELEKLAYKPQDVSKSFKIYDFLHLGMGAGAKLVKEEDLSPLHKAGSSVFREAGRGDPVWVHVNVEGGPRVSLGFPIPIATGLTVSTGFSAGANLRYSITSPYPKELSTRILDSAEEAFDLPLSAARADELVPGETYALEGNSTVSLSESLGVGQGLGGIGGVVRVEASAGEHATISVRGAFKFEVQRLDGQRVRVGISNTKSRSTSAGIHVLVGAYVNRDLFPPPPNFLPGNLDVTIYKALTRKLTNEVAHRLEDILKIDFRLGGGLANEKTFDLAYVFDLRQPAAREAYENALGGDLRWDADSTPGRPVVVEGVTREKYHTLDVVSSSTYATLKLSLLSAYSNTSVTDLKDLEASYDGVVTETRTARFERSGRDIFGNEGRVFLEKSDRHWAGGDREPGATHTVIYRSAETDTYTRRSDVHRILRVTEELLGDAAPRAAIEEIRARRPDRGFLRSAYGDSRLEWEIGFGRAGLGRAIGATDEAVWEAYARVFTAAEKDAPRWATPDGRRTIDNERRWAGGGVGANREDPFLKREIDEMEKAERFVNGVRKIRELRAAGRPEEAVNDELMAMAKNERYDLYGIGALARLAGSGGTTMRMHLTGHDLDFSAAGGEIRDE
ncbi:MAG: hypothetical protein HZA54_14290 [Planctomycetes bacterium]|nr:hypothetical protein [Planctomycetota bacterium]